MTYPVHRLTCDFWGLRVDHRVELFYPKVLKVGLTYGPRVNRTHHVVLRLRFGRRIGFGPSPLKWEVIIESLGALVLVLVA